MRLSRDGQSPVPARRSAVVVNPAKVVDLDGHRRRVGAALAEAGWPEPLWIETTAADPGRGQARQAVDAGAEVVFVCGGDGTVMACAGALAGTEVAMAVLPAGTGNLLAANLGLSTDVAAGVATAVTGGRRRLDVGVVGERCFLVMAGMGFDARLLEDTPDAAKSRFGWPAYVLGALRHLRNRPMRVWIRLDGQRSLRRRARSVLVANVGRLPGGLRLLHEAEPDDGRLDVAVLAPRRLGDWLAMAWAVLRGHARVPRMETFRARQIEIISDRVQPRELDGDVIEPGRSLRVAVRPQALWLCVPHPDETAGI